MQALAERGYVASGSARQLQSADVRRARLIVTAAGVHRAEVIRRDPTAEARCYTLLEAARLVGADSRAASTLDVLVAELAEALANSDTGHDDDLPDPVDGSISDFRQCLTRIETALTDLMG